MPCAPAELVASTRNRLSCQTRRVSRATETWLERDAFSTIRQVISATVPVDPARAMLASAIQANSHRSPRPNRLNRTAGVTHRRTILRFYHLMSDRLTSIETRPSSPPPLGYG